MKDHGCINLALDIRAVFERHHELLDDLSFPFFSQFPTNSCQSASVFLGICLQQLFPEKTVKIIHGTTRGDDNYHHFWVEVDKKVYDLTLDQFQSWLGGRFDGISKPIYSEKKHPLANYFFYKQRDDITDAFVTFVTQHANLNEVLNAFNFCYIELGKLGWFSDFSDLKRDKY